MAVLRAGEQPLWFRLSTQGPVLLDSIEDAVFSTALVPWPLAAHIRFMLAQDDELLLAVNGGGLVRLQPWEEVERDTGLFYLSGGEFWRHYTVGAFVFIDQRPAALLYRDDRFLDSGAALPLPRIWTIDRQLTGLEALAVPALDMFPPDEGWDTDTLHRGTDGLWYFRAIQKDGPQPGIRMLRTANLKEMGEAIGMGTFQNSALPEPLSAAAPLLRELLDTVIEKGTVAALSPDFQQVRYFTKNSGDDTLLLCYYRSKGPEALAVLPGGQGLYARAELPFKSFTLPPLPEHFAYTGIGLAGNTLIAAWEEQEDYNIGAAGFMAIRPAW
jgi:hypothetical protein